MSGSVDYALATRGLTKSYGSRRALDGLDLSVPAGIVYGFLGPNGAGKTTTMRLLTGLVHPDAGRIELLGRPFGRGDRRRLFDVGALIEAPSFYPYLSGRANLREFAAAGAAVSAGRVDELLELVGLRDRATDRVKDYSLGMKQRLAIAVALLSDPRLLLLDEPANGLDPAGIVAVRDTLRGLAGQGKTVFVSSHLLAEVEHLADDVVVINRGRLITAGALAQLQQAGISVRTPSPEPLTRILQAAGGVVDARGNGALLVRGLSTAEIGNHACAAGIALHELAARSGSLEELFLSWTGNETPAGLSETGKEKEVVGQ